ncbi:MAG: hypothetical protein J5574_07410 [Lachnospiraceae bacterium]|nr:hypothetical protein [Lachnospiraceae bacterium]
MIIALTVMSSCLCACGKEPAPKSSFGQVDAMQDGTLLIDNSVPREERETAEDVIEATSASTLKTAKSLDVEDLPEGVARMAGLCDAINMACVEKQSAYSFENSDFMWHCVHLYVGNCTDKALKLTRVSNYVDVNPGILNQIMYAMFGKLRAIPDIPDDAMKFEDGVAHIMITNYLKYRFLLGDRGMSECEVRRATQYSDGSLEMEVALVDSETREETVCFIYSMRANTRDTTTSALFDYEITGARAADRATADRIEGRPFLVPVVMVYGFDAYPAGDVRSNEVEEVLYYDSFKEHVPGMDELNARISGEMLDKANSEVPEGSWHEICSYPMSDSEYVQVAITYALRPDDTDDPEIHCYNYSVKKSRAMDESDAMSLCDTTSAKLATRVSDLWEKSEGARPAGISYSGFMIRKDGSVDVFYNLDVTDAEGAAHRKAVAYNSEADSIRKAFEGEGVIPESETDTMKPKLTHGRKDQQ